MATPPFADFNFSQAPRFYQVKFSGAPHSPDEFSTFLANFDKMYAPQKEFAVLFDARLVEWIGVSNFMELLGYTKHHEELAKLYMQKTAVLVTSPYIQSLIEKLLVLQPPANPTKFFTDKKAALRWLFNVPE